MFTLMHVSQSTDHLVLSYPLWVGAALLLAAAALCACAIFSRKRVRARWAVGVATVVATWAGIYFATFNARITNDAGSVYAFLKHDHSIRWKDASDIYLERRSGARGWQIVVLDRQRRAFAFDVADLSVDDRDQVLAYMVDRMPPDAFPREPALLKRKAPDHARRVGLFADQQI
jgi:hypothetical protein